MDITVKITLQDVNELIRQELLFQFPEIKWHINGPSYSRSDWMAESMTPEEIKVEAEEQASSLIPTPPPIDPILPLATSRTLMVAIKVSQ